MKIIISGSPRDIDFVKTVCRHKIRRGELRLSSCRPVAEKEIKPEDEVTEDDEEAYVETDSKEPVITDDKFTDNKDTKGIPEIKKEKARKVKKKE